MKTKNKEVFFKLEGTQTGRDYFKFQFDLLGYVLEDNGNFVPKWMAFFNGYTPTQLKSGIKKVKARLYTLAEEKERFPNREL